MLVTTVFVTFFVLSASTVVLLILLKTFLRKNPNTNPQFLSFQRGYLLIYYLVIFGDWLNAPYLYKLYSDYGFVEDQIAIIYVCGYVSALAFGSTASYFVKTHGQCRVYVLATLMYALTCILKLSPSYTVLIVGRLLAGAATSLLFCAQEAWYVDSHMVTHDFPPEWIDLTFAKSSLGNSFFAVLSGVITYLLCEVFTFSPVAPSIVSIFVLLPSCILAVSKWKKSPENKSTLGKVNNNTPSSITTIKNKQTFKACCHGLQTIFRNPQLLQIGCIQALYESVLCLFVFLWTPVLDHHHPPLGMVFASFMASHLLGSTLYKVLRDLVKMQTRWMMIWIFVASSGAVLTCVLSTHPSNEFPVVSFCAFLVFELASGMYFPAMTDMKKELKVDQLKTSATSWFRVPLNLLACGGLLLLHSNTNVTGTKNLFACCFVAVLVGLIIVIKLSRSAKPTLPKVIDQYSEHLLSESL